MKKLPVQSRAGRWKIAYAASAMISGLRHCFMPSSPPRMFWIAEVAMAVRGHRQLKAIPLSLNSSAIDHAKTDMPYLASV